MANRSFETTRSMSEQGTSELDYTPRVGSAKNVVTNHSGHTIQVHADYGVWCATDGVFINNLLEKQAIKNPGL